MKKLLLSIAVLGLVTVLSSSCNKVCNCTVKSGETVLPGYESLPVGEISKDDCAAFQDSTWNSLGYTYTCVSE